MTDINPFDYSVTFRGVFGPGSLSVLPERASQLGIQKTLIVCDQTIVSLGLTQRARELLSTVSIESVVFDKCTENPKDSEINAGAALFKEEGCDSVIGLGGGSSLDSAKVIRLVAKQGRTVADYSLLQGGAGLIQPDQYPFIAVPTTSGTGAEITAAAVITHGVKKHKFIVASPSLSSSLVILDPELTRTMPPLVTAATGMDALIHALEGYVSKIFNPLGESHCHRSFELTGKSLKRAVANGDDMDARSDMLLASFLGGMVIKIKGLGAVHALGHPLSSVCGIPHGTTLSIMLPHIMRFNAPAAGALYVEALRRMGMEVSSADDAATAMTDYAGDLGLPTRLSEAGVSEADLTELVRQATADLSHISNPVALAPDDFVTLYKNAF